MRYSRYNMTPAIDCTATRDGFGSLTNDYDSPYRKSTNEVGSAVYWPVIKVNVCRMVRKPAEGRLPKEAK